MRDYALQLLNTTDDSNKKLNLLREYLQAYILRILYESNFFKFNAFVGGTALRLLYGLPRFSEDLDFSLKTISGSSFQNLLKKIKADLEASGYQIEISYKDQKVVHSAFIKFNRLLFDAGVSAYENQKLSIKIEIDTKPPVGASFESKVLLVHFPIEVLCYNVESLFSGKCHALLSRRYTKGRDYFDLAWYLSKWDGLNPNIKLLNNSLEQNKSNAMKITQKNWRKIISDNVSKADWKQVEADVANFLERRTDMSIFSKENVLTLLAG